MSVKLFNNQEVQDLLRTAAGLTNEGGSQRAKEIAHRIISDLYKAIDDLNITSDEYWAGVAYLNKLGERGEAGLLSPGLGFVRFLDMRMDAEDAQRGVESKTPRTIEGPLYVVGAPVEQGLSRLDDGTDKDGHPLIMHDMVIADDGKQVPGAKDEVRHCTTTGFCLHLDQNGTQQKIKKSP